MFGAPRRRSCPQPQMFAFGSRKSLACRLRPASPARRSSREPRRQPGAGLRIRSCEICGLVHRPNKKIDMQCHIFYRVPGLRKGTPMYKKYIVRLTAEEREICHETVRRGSSERVRRAWILLKADADGPAWTDRKIAEAFSCWRQTVENIRRNFVEEGRALERKRRETPPVPKIRRGGSQGHRPVRGAARVRQLVVAVAGREGCGVRGLHKPRNGEADAKKTAFPAKGKSSTG